MILGWLQEHIIYSLFSFLAQKHEILYLSPYDPESFELMEIYFVVYDGKMLKKLHFINI
jgi:hypothetical protein